MSKVYDLVPKKPKFRRGEQLRWKRGDTKSQVTFLDRISKNLCKVINDRGLIETAYDFELETAIATDRSSQDDSSSSDKSYSTTRRPA